MDYIEISANWLDSASDNELNRILLGENDGQGDHI